MYRDITLAAVFLAAMMLPFPASAEDNVLTNSEKEAGWQLLFNGKDLSGWKCNNGKPIATQVDDGSIVPYKAGGYLVIHENQFDNFVLKCDVRWEDPNCNSGIFFRVEDPKNPVHTGFEVQIMGGSDVGKHQFGAIYDLAATTKNAGKETGHWNQVEIRCDGPHISVAVNGAKVCTLNCDDFSEPGLCPDGQKHKFKLNGQPRAVKNFARKGYLGFQDHGHKVWYKNVKLLPLTKSDQPHPKNRSQSAPKDGSPTSEKRYDTALAQQLGADDYGMKSYVFVVLKTGKATIEDQKKSQEIFAGHFSNMERLANEGKLVLAGPLIDGRPKRGIFILNVATVEEAEELVKTDPAVKAGVFDYELTKLYCSAALMKVNEIHRTIQKAKIN